MNRKLLTLVTLVSLLLPLLPASVALAGPPAQTEGEVYTVQKDDWLSKIAEKEYGNPLAYQPLSTTTT